MDFARVVELVDTQDLKSCDPYRSCGFNSRPGYHKAEKRLSALRPLFLLL